MRQREFGESGQWRELGGVLAACGALLGAAPDADARIEALDARSRSACALLPRAACDAACLADQSAAQREAAVRRVAREPAWRAALLQLALEDSCVGVLRALATAGLWAPAEVEASDALGRGSWAHVAAEAGADGAVFELLAELGCATLGAPRDADGRTPFELALDSDRAIDAQSGSVFDGARWLWRHGFACAADDKETQARLTRCACLSGSAFALPLVVDEFGFDVNAVAFGSVMCDLLDGACCQATIDYLKAHGIDPEQ